jgi:hypothetical protein
MDVTKTVRERYDQVTKDIRVKEAEVAELKKELAPLAAYLKSSGVLETQRRSRKKEPPAE